jgi:hypothetical protein
LNAVTTAIGQVGLTLVAIGLIVLTLEAVLYVLLVRSCRRGTRFRRCSSRRQR